MKKYACLSIGILLACGSVKAQQKRATKNEQFIFFQGDTLTGFDLKSVIKDAKSALKLEVEQKAYVYQREWTFVKKKYNLSAPVAVYSHRMGHISNLSSGCNNVDLETGDFTGWAGDIGYNTNSNGALTITSNTISSAGINSTEPSCSFHTLVTSAAGNDPYGGFPMLDNGGGNFAVRIGGENINTQSGFGAGSCAVNDPTFSGYSNGERLENTITVTPQNTLLTYRYAIVLNDGGHANGSQPYFKFEVLDSAGNTLPCFTIFAQASSGTAPAGFSISSSTSPYDASNVFYKPWTTGTMNLTGYMGHTLTLRVTAAGCQYGSHFAYGYFDCVCGQAEIIPGSPVFCHPTSTVLTAPSGFLAYSWGGPGIVGSSSTQTITVNAAGTYSVTLFSIMGPSCSTTLSTTLLDTCNKVWPGDANENLVVDNTDLFPIGVKFGATGPSRSVQGNTWQGDPCLSWSDTLSNGKNTKYADCDGDGIIGFNDTLAINLNYGLTHLARYGSPQIVQTVNPDIYLQFDKPQYAPGDTLRASVYIGSASNVQSNFYGAAFTLNYDNSKVQPGTEKFWYNNSWVGNINTGKIKFAKLNTSAGTVDASLVRITHTDANGYGKVATLQFVLNGTLPNGELYFTINNALKTDYAGGTSALNSGTDSVAVVNGTTSISSLSTDGISVYPNPASDLLYISSRTRQAIYSIEIFDVVSRRMKIYTFNDSNDTITLPIFDLERGAYFIKVNGKRGELFLKE